MAQRGSIQKRTRADGTVSYRVRLRVPGTDTWSTKTFRTRKAAQGWLNEQLGDAQHGMLVARRTDTVASYLSGWLDHLEVVVGRRKTTVDRYRSLVKHHAAPALGGLELQQVTPAHVDALYTEMTAKGAAPASVRHLHSVLRKAFADAVAKGMLARNPVQSSSPPSIATAGKEMSVWTPHQLDQFFELTDGHPLSTLWRLAALTGMRRGELCGLRWACVDLRKGNVRIEHTRTTSGHSVVVGEPKTSYGRRNISLDPGTVDALKALRQRELEERVAHGRRDIDQDYVFLNLFTGEPIHPNSVSHGWDELLAHLPLPRIRFHDLRHTHATHLLATGADPVVVSRRLGHANVAFTLTVYGHVLPGRDEEAALAVAALVAGSRARSAPTIG